MIIHLYCCIIKYKKFEFLLQNPGGLENYKVPNSHDYSIQEFMKKFIPNLFF